MKYLSKFLFLLKQDSKLFKHNDFDFIIGLTKTQLKELKKYAIDNNYINQDNSGCTLTLRGDNYLNNNSIESWCIKEHYRRPEINLEYLKEDKIPCSLTKGIRELARHLILGDEIKINSIAHYLFRELLCVKSTCVNIRKDIEDFILQDSRVKISCVFEKFSSKPYGLTKSIIAVLLLDILVKNKDIAAIYERLQFQLKFDPLMLDRMIHCPENFEVQKTVVEDLPIIEELSAIILPCKSKNILDITKGLIYFIKNLEKYTIQTERLSKKTIRYRNAILNAKDPIQLLYCDIPKILNDKILCQCDKNFVIAFEEAMEELQNCHLNLLNELKSFLFKEFETDLREDLTSRFRNLTEFLSSDDLKILNNSIQDISSPDNSWLEKIATFINVSRVPKDWFDNDVADFKVKIKDLAFKFKIIEATVCEDIELDSTLQNLLNQILKLNDLQRKNIFRKVINIKKS